MRNVIVSGLIGALAASAPAWARTLTEDIVQQLRDQGYNRISVSRTLLGRDRILGSSTTRDREIVVNPRTGEILRDYWEDRDPVVGPDTILDLEDASGPSVNGKPGISDSASSGSDESKSEAGDDGANGDDDDRSGGDGAAGGNDGGDGDDG